MSQLFRDAFTTPAGAGLAGPASGLNLYETNEGYVLQLLLPGLRRDQLDLNIQQNVLTVQGQMALAAPEGARALVIGTGSGEVREQVQLPGEVDAEGATADYQDGVLTVTLPKAARAKARTIKVGGGSSSAIEGQKK